MVQVADIVQVVAFLVQVVAFLVREDMILHLHGEEMDPADPLILEEDTVEQVDTRLVVQSPENQK